MAVASNFVEWGIAREVLNILAGFKGKSFCDYTSVILL